MRQGRRVFSFSSRPRGGRRDGTTRGARRKEGAALGHMVARAGTNRSGAAFSLPLRGGARRELRTDPAVRRAGGRFAGRSSNVRGGLASPRRRPPGGPGLSGRRPGEGPRRQRRPGDARLRPRPLRLDAARRRSRPRLAPRAGRRTADSTPAPAPGARDRLRGPRNRDAVRRGDARPGGGGGRGGGLADVHDLRDRDGDGLRRRVGGRARRRFEADGGAPRSGEEAPHRREPVHDGVHQQGRRQAAGGVRGALRRQDPAHGPVGARRRVDLPEGLVPLRRSRRPGGDRVPEEDRRRPLRRRGLHHAEADGRRPHVRPRGRDGPRRRSRRGAVPPRRHRVPRGDDAVDALRHPARRRREDGALRRRRALLRDARRTRSRLAPVAASLAPRRPDRLRRLPHRPRLRGTTTRRPRWRGSPLASGSGSWRR